MKLFKALVTVIGLTILREITGSNVDIFPATPANEKLCHCRPGANDSPCTTLFVWDATVNECVPTNVNVSHSTLVAYTDSVSGHKCANTVIMGGNGLSSIGRVKRETNGVRVLCGTKECQADIYLYNVCNRSAQLMVVTNARIEVTNLESLTLHNGVKSYDIVPKNSTNTTSMTLPVFPAEYEMTFFYKSLDRNNRFKLDIDVCCWPRNFVCGQHCTSCSVAGPGKCNIGACDYGYYLNGDNEECEPKCGRHCTTCNHAGPGKCDFNSCHSGYDIIPGTEECKPRCAKHCVSCQVSGPGKCDRGSCKRGYYLSYDKTACKPHYPTRLYNRNTNESMTGRLEIYYRGDWGTVCDDSFDDVAASVACYSINPRYQRGKLISKNSANYGPGNRNILLDDVKCSSGHINIAYCNHRAWGEHNCSPAEDVAIRCEYTGCHRDPCPNGATCEEVVSDQDDYICVCGDEYYRPQCRTGTLTKITS